MKGNAARLVRFGAGLLVLVVVGWVLAGQAAKPAPLGFTTDWSHRHVVYTRPATTEQARLVQGDPRYWQQWYRHNTVRTLSLTTASNNRESLAGIPSAAHAQAQRDWAQNLGNGAHLAPGVFPAKYSFHTEVVRCGNLANPDFVVFPTGLLGSGTQASIVAYTNLWIGCGGTIPRVYWAYNTGGQILTSPVFSQDGLNVTFVQTNAGAASMVLLKWKSSTTQTVGSPGVPTVVAAASYRTCTAPCMTTFPLQDGSNVATDDTTSSIFYDYSGDIAWVGDSGSWLHKFTPVFHGTPAEIRSAPWPVQANPDTPTALTSPVHDITSSNVYFGDLGGFAYRVNSTTGAVTRSTRIDFGTGIVAGPILDVVARRVYFFSSSDGSPGCSGSPCSAIFQFFINFAPGAPGVKAQVGTSSLTPSPLYDGAFDSDFENSIAGSGNLYVCGNTGGVPTLYLIPILGSVMDDPVAGPPLSNTASACSPVTDVRNPNATGGIGEWIFASVHTGGLPTLCAGAGCVMNFKSTPWEVNTSYPAGYEVIDNNFQIQVVRTAGISRAGQPPAWSTTVGGTTTDFTVTWVNQGVHKAFRPNWATSHAYALADQIVDSNGNVQVVITAGTSAATAHAWNKTPGNNTLDGTVLWKGLGPLATSNLNAAGGTSGIIMDAIVAGASDVYYSTQSNQVCGTTGTGGCAVQASQAALK